MQSLSNHTQLVLTKSSISIGTSYDEAFNSSWDKCENHLLEKVRDVFLFIEALQSVKINFIGLVAQIIKDEYDDASKYIFENLLNFASTQSVYDTECKLTYVLKDKYYINLEIQNVRLFNGKPMINSTEFVPVVSDDNVQNKLVVSIDINNRYSFNFNKTKSTTDNDDVNEIVSYTRQLVENLDYIVKGMLKLKISSITSTLALAAISLATLTTSGGNHLDSFCLKLIKQLFMNRILEMQIPQNYLWIH